MSKTIRSVVKRSSTKTPSKVKSSSKKASSKAKGSSTRTAAVREVEGIFVDRQLLDHALSALVNAGFHYGDMTAVLERHGDGGRRIAVTNIPQDNFTQADKQQARTLSTSLAGAVAALAAAGITIASGGAAVAAVAAAALVGGSAATGVHVIKTMTGFDGASEDVILSVRAKKPADEKRIADIFDQHGAKQIWVQNRSY
jgi:hypothetical protein